MTDLKQLETELKDFIVETLALEDIAASDISSDAILFGDDGLGLDSVDALELGVAVQKRYKVRIDPNAEQTREHFSCVRSLAAFISAQQAALV